MAHIKIVSPSGWDWEAPVASMVKVGSSGRMGAADFGVLVKRAGDCAANVFRDSIHKFASDEMPVHLIALGAGEAWGPNRNGDSFSEETLKAAHDTFVKHAFWFRNHKNKPHEGHPKFGLVKASAYNDRMRRVELLCSLPVTKAAADRMGVLVADKEHEKLASGGDIPVSMACRVPYDVCSGCGNKARTREEYCKEATCKYGGCHDNLTKLVKMAGDAHVLHVDNPNPMFFDISNVFKPADRTAYAGRADWTKAAEDGFFGAGGSKSASDLGVAAPISVIVAQDANRAGASPRLEGQIKISHGLAALDQQPEKWASAEVARAFTAAAQPDMDLAALGLSEWSAKTASVLGALADAKILMPLRDFARMTKRAGEAEEAARRLPGVYYRMVSDGSLADRLSANRYDPAEKSAEAKTRQTVARLTQTYSLEKSAVDHRCRKSAVLGHAAPVLKNTFEFEKTAGDSPAAEELARDYACYKAAALYRISESDERFVLTARMSACQNSTT